MEKTKLIESTTYSIQVPKSWTIIEFNKEKYELGITTENNTNRIFFNIQKCFSKYNTESEEGQFGFGKMRVNILNEPLETMDETYCGNIDILNKNNFEKILLFLETITPKEN